MPVIAAGSSANGTRRIPKRAKLTNVVEGVRMLLSSVRTKVVKLTNAISEGVKSQVIMLMALRCADCLNVANCKEYAK